MTLKELQRAQIVAYERNRLLTLFDVWKPGSSFEITSEMREPGKPPNDYLHVVAARPEEILPALKVLIAARVAECEAELRELGVTLDEESAARPRYSRDRSPSRSRCGRARSCGPSIRSARASSGSRLSSTVPAEIEAPQLTADQRAKATRALQRGISTLEVTEPVVPMLQRERLEALEAGNHALVAQIDDDLADLDTWEPDPDRPGYIRRKTPKSPE